MRSAWTIQKSVIYAFFARELKTRFGDSRLGYLWALLEPLAHTIIFLVILGRLGSRAMPGVDFKLFLITGIMVFSYYGHISSRAAEGINANRALLAYRYVQPIDDIWARILLETVIFVCVFVSILFLIALLGHDVLPARPLEVCLAYFLLLVFSLGIGLSFGVAYVLYPDSRKILSMLQRPLYFLSGVIFPISVVPSPYKEWLMWNPILHAIELGREAYFPAYPHGGMSWVFLSVSSALTLLFGLALYRVKRFQILASR